MWVFLKDVSEGNDVNKNEYFHVLPKVNRSESLFSPKETWKIYRRKSVRAVL